MQADKDDGAALGSATGRHLAQSDPAGDAAVAATIARLREAAMPTGRAGNLAGNADPAAQTVRTGVNPGRRLSEAAAAHVSASGRQLAQSDSASNAKVAATIARLREAATPRGRAGNLAGDADPADQAARTGANPGRRLAQATAGSANSNGMDSAANMIAALKSAAATAKPSVSAAASSKGRPAGKPSSQGGRRLMQGSVSPARETAPVIPRRSEAYWMPYSG